MVCSSSRCPRSQLGLVDPGIVCRGELQVPIRWLLNFPWLSNSGLFCCPSWLRILWRDRGRLCAFCRHRRLLRVKCGLLSILGDQVFLVASVEVNDYLHYWSEYSINVCELHAVIEVPVSFEILWEITFVYEVSRYWCACMCTAFHTQYMAKIGAMNASWVQSSVVLFSKPSIST